MEITDIYQNTVKTYDYDAYGNILGEDGSLEHNAFTYTAREYHPRSGLYYYRARWYDPEIGRFITQDPIGFLGGVNLYAYVGNNPVNGIDPWGLWDNDVHSGIDNPVTDRYGTFYWSLQEGINDIDARLIAIANNRADNPWYGNSWAPGIGEQSRHFDTDRCSDSDSRDHWADFEMDQAIENYMNGNLETALTHLGRGLHSVQDKYAHRRWDVGNGFNQHPGWYDDWADPRNSEARTLTEKATREYLRRYLDRTGQR